MAKRKPLVPPSHIGADELAYLTVLIAAKQRADQTLNEFTGYLSQKYALVDGDGLKPDGTIERKAAL